MNELDNKPGVQWQNQTSEDERVWSQQLSTALGSKGFSARVLAVSELLLELLDTQLGRLVGAALAVTLAFFLL